MQNSRRCRSAPGGTRPELPHAARRAAGGDVGLDVWHRFSRSSDHLRLGARGAGPEEAARCGRASGSLARACPCHGASVPRAARAGSPQRRELARHTLGATRTAEPGTQHDRAAEPSRDDARSSRDGARSSPHDALSRPIHLTRTRVARGATRGAAIWFRERRGARCKCVVDRSRSGSHRATGDACSARSARSPHNVGVCRAERVSCDAGTPCAAGCVSRRTGVDAGPMREDG